MSVEIMMPIPRRSEVARMYKQQGGMVGAVLPIHYPRALLRAFNILPMEVWGPPRVDIDHGAAHLQSYVCSVVRNALSFLKIGGLDVVDLIIVPHACDSLQGLGSVLVDFVKPVQHVIPLYPPRGKGEGAIAYFADEMRSMYRQLEGITHRSPSNDELLESIQREETADGLLINLHSKRKNLRLSDYEFYRLIRAREFVPAETFSQLAQAALDQVSKPVRDGIPIVLSGIVPEPMELLKSISGFGGLVVADDLACCGRRLYPAGSSDDPFVRMAERILEAPPDWSRGSPISDRLDHLIRLSEMNEAKGVVFYNVKFCEPELFDHPDLRRGLQEAGIPTTLVEVDLNEPLSNQILTRIEAFFEMIT
jgi:benzoyl-CoA reductase/2-hydroxyglutaryl-CoA dehydratase subunit BcrC/BadD/HgdB